MATRMRSFRLRFHAENSRSVRRLRGCPRVPEMPRSAGRPGRRGCPAHDGRSGRRGLHGRHRRELLLAGSVASLGLRPPPGSRSSRHRRRLQLALPRRAGGHLQSTMSARDAEAARRPTVRFLLAASRRASGARDGGQRAPCVVRDRRAPARWEGRWLDVRDARMAAARRATPTDQRRSPRPRRGRRPHVSSRRLRLANGFRSSTPCPSGRAACRCG